MAGTTFTATHEPKQQVLSISLRWADSGTGRPANVTANLFGDLNGDGQNLTDLESVTLQPSPDEGETKENVWTAECSVNYFTRAESYVTEENRTSYKSYSVTVVAVEGYTATITPSADGYSFDILMKANGYDTTAADNVITLIDNLGESNTPKSTRIP